MKYMNVGLMAVALSCLLVACGGGNPSDEPNVFLQPHPVATGAGPLSDMAVPTPRQAAIRTPDAYNFLNWAESAYPNFFPSAQSNKTIDVWTYRYYSQTDIYLGTNTNGDVLGLVGKGGGAYDSVPLGKISDFSCSVYPTDCAITGASDLISTGSSLASYPSGTVERGAFDELIRVRTGCGFGGLLQNTKLDAAEAAHAYYLAKNSADSTDTDFIGHYESSERNYYTGNAPWDRAVFQGYQYEGLAEILSALGDSFLNTSPSPITVNAALGTSSIRDLIATVYHLQGSLYEGRDVGIGSNSQVGIFTSRSKYQAFRYGTTVAWMNGSSPQKLGTAIVASYPCGRITNVRPNFSPAIESPNPFPNITDTKIEIGTPIYFKVDSGQTLTVTSFVLTRVSTNTIVTTTTLTSANDPNARLKAHEVFFVPTAQLSVNELYRVQASGTVDRTAFSKDFVFGTGPHE